MQALTGTGVGLLLLLGALTPALAQSPTACSVLSEQALLESFSDDVPAAGIKPRQLRDQVCSTWGSASFSSPPPIGNVVPNTGAFSSLSFSNLTSTNVSLTSDQVNLVKNYSAPWGSADPHQQVLLANITTPVLKQLWNNFDDLNYQVPGGVDSGPLSALVTRYVNFRKNTRSPNIPNWPLIVSGVDFTGQISSVSGAMIGQEIDLEVSGIDDLGLVNQGRMGLALNIFRGRSYGGTDSQVSVGVNVFGDPANTSLGFIFNGAARWTKAGLNLADGASIGGAPAIRLKGGQAIEFNAVTGGARTILYDSTALVGVGGLRATANLQVDGTLFVPNALTVGGLSTLTTLATTGNLTVGGVAALNGAVTVAGGTTLNGAVNLVGALSSAGIPAVSCGSVVAATVVVVNGVVTHC